MSTALEREHDINIPTTDNLDIFCRVNTASNTLSQKAVILAHGLTGHVNEYIHMSARDFFTKRGYDVYRISFYCDGENHRKLQNTTLQIHANDLNKLIQHLKEEKSYDNIYVCGHSYGGATILFANPETSANAFWDSTIYPWEGHWRDLATNLEHFGEEFFIQCWTGMPMLFGNAMLEEAKTNNPEIMRKKAASISSPSFVGIAEYGDFEKNKRKELYESLTCKKEYTLIKGADHCFNNGNTVQDLLEETYKWFERH